MRGEGVAFHLGGRHQALVGHRAAYAAAGEAVDDQRSRAGFVQRLGVVVLAMALDAGAAGQDDHAGCRFAGSRQMQTRRQPRRPTGRRMIERQCIERQCIERQ